MGTPRAFVAAIVVSFLPFAPAFAQQDESVTYSGPNTPALSGIGLMPASTTVFPSAGGSTSPVAIADLVADCSAYSCKLTWTVPPVVAGKGQVSTYDIHYSKVTISPNALGNAALTAMAAGGAGKKEEFVIRGLDAGEKYYFAVLSHDAGAPASTTLSNTAQGSTSSEHIGEIVRLIGGFEQSGAASAGNQQNFFGDLYVSTPLPVKLSGRSLRIWGYLRTSTVPVQISSTFKDFTGTFAEEFGKVKVNEIAKSIEYAVGLEIPLLESGLFTGLDRGAKQKFTVSLLGGFGASTPTVPKDTVEIFTINAAARARFPEIPAAAVSLALVDPDRDRFLQRWFFGFRFKTYYFDSATGEPSNRYPATFDLAVGKNAAVTGGDLGKAVVSVSGFLPLPWKKVGFIHLFGEGHFRWGSGSPGQAPLLLQAAADTVTVHDATTYLMTRGASNRDYYRIGIGINVIDLIKALNGDE